MLSTITQIIFLILLYILAVIDLRFRIVPNTGPVLCLALGIVRICAGILSPGSALAGFLLLGGGTLLLALFTGGIGGGDVKLLAGAGLFLGAWEGLHLLLLSFFLSGIFALGLKLAPLFLENPRISRVKEIPFVPFAAAAATLIFAGNGL